MVVGKDFSVVDRLIELTMVFEKHISEYSDEPKHTTVPSVHYDLVNRSVGLT